MGVLGGLDSILEVDWLVVCIGMLVLGHGGLLALLDLILDGGLDGLVLLCCCLSA